MLLGPSLKGPTSISLLQFYQGYIFVPHWCLVLWTPFHHLGWTRWFSLCPLPLLVPSLHGLMSISLLWFEEGYNCIPHWCWEGGPPSLGTLLVVNALLSLLMVLVVFTLPCCATCPFLPWIHLNDYLAIALSILRGGWSEVDYLLNVSILVDLQLCLSLKYLVITLKGFTGVLAQTLDF